MAKMAHQIAKAVIKPYTHPNSPQVYTQPQLVACVLLKIYLNISYRDMEEWLAASDRLCEALELEWIPDHTTLYRAYQRLREPILRQLNYLLLRHCEVVESAVAVDATGLRTSKASQHYITRSGKKFTNWFKGFFAVGIERQFILSWCSDKGPGGLDAKHLNRLRQRAKPFAYRVKNRLEWIILGDKGFDGKDALPTDLIPPRQARRRAKRRDRILRADLTDMARLDGFFGQRWKVETVNSVVKRLMGDVLPSRKYRHIHRDVGMKAIAYNLHR